jgi:membrane protein
LFLAWVQVSWIIVLFGAEICEAVQNSDSTCGAAGCPAPTPIDKKLIALHLTRTAVRRFAAGDPPLDAAGLAQAINLPQRLVQPVLADLVAAHVLSETAGGRSEKPRYQPAMDLSHLTLQRVADAVESAGAAEGRPRLHFEDSERLWQALQEMTQAAAASPANRRLKDL